MSVFARWLKEQFGPRRVRPARRPGRLAVRELERRDAPVASLYAGLPAAVFAPDIPTPDYAGATTGTVVYVSPDGNNPHGATTGTNGSITNPKTLTEALAGDADGQTLVLFGGQYRGISYGSVDKKIVLQAYYDASTGRYDKPWVNGALVVPAAAWQEADVDLNGDGTVQSSERFWRTRTTTAGGGVGNFEFPNRYGVVQVDVTKNPLSTNGEQVYVSDNGGPQTPLQQVGKYWKMRDGWTSSYSYYRVSDDGKSAVLIGHDTNGDGDFADPGESQAADWAAWTNPNANLAELNRSQKGDARTDHFFVDYVNHYIYMAVDPTAAGRAVEVTANDYGLQVNATATVRGVGFDHYASTGFTINSGGVGAVVEDCAFAWNGASGYGQQGPNSVVLNNLAVANGEAGGGGSHFDGFVVNGNTVTYNNIEQTWGSWSAAGLKYLDTRNTVFVNNTIRNNQATGLWLDTNVLYAKIVGNTFGNGVYVEISSHNDVAFNTFANCNLGISGSSDTRAYNNTFSGGTAVSLRETQRVQDRNDDDSSGAAANQNNGQADGVPNEGEDDHWFEAGSHWENEDNEFYNNLFTETTTGTNNLIETLSGGIQSATSSSIPTVNSRVTGRPYGSPTEVAAMDYNGYRLAGSANNFIDWWNGVWQSTNYGVQTYNTLAAFGAFLAANGFEAHTATSGARKLIYDDGETAPDGGADPFFVNAAGGDFRLRTYGTGTNPAAGRTAGVDLKPVPADILAAAGLAAQPTYLGALPSANPDTTPPAVAFVGPQTTAERLAAGDAGITVPLTVSGDTAAVAVGSTNPTLVPLAGLVVTGTGTSRTLAITPALNQVGTSLVTVAVSDAAGNVARESFLVTVTPRNGRPSATAAAGQLFVKTAGTAPVTTTAGWGFAYSSGKDDNNFPVAENQPFTLHFVVADDGGAGHVVATAHSVNQEYISDSSIQTGVEGGDPTKRFLTFTPGANRTGTVTVVLTLTDNDGTGATVRIPILFDIERADGNRAPRVYAINPIPTVPAGGSTGKIQFTVKDLETPNGNNLTLTASSSDTALVPNANLVLGGGGASRTITVTPVAGRSGTAVITLTVTDPGYGPDGKPGTGDETAPSTATKSFTVVVNSPPTGINLSNAAVPENQPAGTAVGTLSAVDPAPTGDSYTYALVGGVGSDDNGSFVIAGNQLRTAAAFDYEAKGSYTVRVRVTDFAGAAVERVFTVAVTDVNEPPAVQPGTPASLAYRTGTGSAAILPNLTAADPDGTLRGATVRIGGNYAADPDVLTWVAQPGITFTWDPAGGTLTLAGTASVAAYQAALRAVGFRNDAPAPAAGDRTVTFAVTDGEFTATAAATVAVASGYRTQTDPLADLSGTDPARSDANWHVDASKTDADRAHFPGDDQRAVRDTNAAASALVWDRQDLAGFSLTAWFYAPSVGGTDLSPKVQFLTSADGVTWTAVTVTAAPAVASSGGWYRATFSTSALLPRGANFLKVVVLRTGNPWDVQLGELTTTTYPAG